MSGPPWWLAYAWAASLWVAAGCVGMAVLSACIDRVGRNGPEKGPQRPSRGLGALRRPDSRLGPQNGTESHAPAPRAQPEPQTRTNHTDMETR